MSASSGIPSYLSRAPTDEKELAKAMRDPQYRAMLQQMIIERQSLIEDSAAGIIGKWKDFGIECLNKNSLQERSLSEKEVIIVKETYTKAIAMMASIALERPIKAGTAENMYKVLIQEGHDKDAFTRVHGDRFPREFTNAGWRSSFKALSDYVEGFID